MSYSKTSVKNAKHLEAVWLNVTNSLARLRRYYPVYIPMGKFEIDLIEELRQAPKIVSKYFYTRNIVDINQLIESGLIHWLEPLSGSGRILAEDFVEEMTLEITHKGALGVNPVDIHLQMMEQELRKLADFIHETAPKGSLTYESCMKPKQEQIDIQYKTAFKMACTRITNMTDAELEEFINDSKEMKNDKLVQYAISVKDKK